MSTENSNRITGLEICSYALLSMVILIGIVLSFVNEDYFVSVYVVEDGILEYLTAVLLFIIGAVSLRRIVLYRHLQKFMFLCTNGAIVLLMFFGAGEEISWGQRIFDIESTDYFLAYNRQGELNLHNMSLNGVNMNALIFGRALTIFLIIYYLILPSIYRRKQRFRGFADSLYVPIPKIHHGIGILVAGLAIRMIESEKSNELKELAIAMFLLLTVVCAQNLSRITEVKS